MRKSRFTEEQIVAVRKEGEGGAPGGTRTRHSPTRNPTGYGIPSGLMDRPSSGLAAVFRLVGASIPSASA
jgi:hypothetical protein